MLYESDLAAVWLGDALGVLPNLETESIPLVVTDPPYGVAWKSTRRAETFEPIANDRPRDRGHVASVLAECVRVTGQNRHLYVFGPTDVLEGLAISKAVELVWDKAMMGTGDLAIPWGPGHEPITFAVTKYRHREQIGRDDLPARIRKGTVLRYPRPSGNAVRHPSEKPIALCRELVESSSRQGETVLDPFAGIGSTGVAAVLAGRKTILVELDPGYAMEAVARVRRAEEFARLGAAL